MPRVGITIGLDALLATFIVVSAPAFGQDAEERIKESTCAGPTRSLGSRTGPRRRACSEAVTSPTGHPTEEVSRGIFVPVITDRAGPPRFRRSGASRPVGRMELLAGTRSSGASILPRVALLCGGGLSFPATHSHTLKKKVVQKMRQKVVRRAVLFLVSVALASVALGGVAAAHPLDPPFESDITQDKIINFCNPDPVRPGLFRQAISDWNSYAVDNSVPVIVDVTDSEGAFCELRPEWQGGDSAPYLAQVDFRTHPDDLDLSEGFKGLERDQEGATLRHELGHAAVGLGHNEMCAESIMPTWEFCRDNGTPRRATVGPHDAEDRLAYWNGPTAIYPRPNKCWTNEDADRNGVCDRFGPPLGSPRALRAESAGPKPVEAPPNLKN